MDDCFPSYILGALAYREEAASDVVLYVEDDSARAIVERLVFRSIADQYADDALAPGGGITNVLRFFVRQRPLLPAISRAYVVLDADAEDTVVNATAHDIIQIARDEAARISYLPFTPEVGLVAFLHSDRAVILGKLRQHFSLHTLALTRADIAPMPGPQEPKPRRVCKTILEDVCQALADQLPNASPDDGKVVLFKLLADHAFETNRACVLRQFGPILRG